MRTAQRLTLVSDQTGDIDDFPISSWVSSSSSFWYCLASYSSSRTQHMFTSYQHRFIEIEMGHTGITSDLEYSVQIDL
jgi:hypothetical protein